MRDKEAVVCLFDTDHQCSVLTWRQYGVDMGGDLTNTLPHP